MIDPFTAYYLTRNKEPWCNTCGKIISQEDYEKDGECPSCRKWWKDNPPPDSGVIDDF